MIENPPHAVTIQNRGLWRVAIGFTDFKSGNYRSAQFCAYLIQSALRFQIGIFPPGLFHNFRVGANQLPLCSFQKRKAAYIPPENRGYARPGSNLLPENSGYWLGMFPLVAMLCKVTFQIEPLKDEIRCLAALPCLCNV